MNKRLFNLFIAFILIFTSACSNNKDNKEILATTEFDGMIVTIYHDPNTFNNNGVYFSNDRDKIPHNITAPTMKNTAGDQMLYVDFRGNEHVLYNDEIIEPVEIYPVEVDGIDFNLTIYHLDTDKQYHKIGKNEKEYQFMTCAASDTSRSYVCTGDLDIDYEAFMALISTWKQVSLDETGLKHSDLKVFLEINYNKVELNGSQYVLIIGKAELENNEWIVNTFDSTNTYYQLTSNQVAELNAMINN